MYTNNFEAPPNVQNENQIDKELNITYLARPFERTRLKIIKHYYILRRVQLHDERFSERDRRLVLYITVSVNKKMLEGLEWSLGHFSTLRICGENAGLVNQQG